MKPCKGCCYFRISILGNKCDYYATEQIRIDPLSLRKYRRMIGSIDAVIMRSEKGECGPDRKFYDTYKEQFKRWIRGFL